MAKNTSTVYLGYEDEAITEKNKSLVDFMTNKVGGQPVMLIILSFFTKHIAVSLKCDFLQHDFVLQFD